MQRDENRNDVRAAHSPESKEKPNETDGTMETSLAILPNSIEGDYGS